MILVDLQNSLEFKMRQKFHCGTQHKARKDPPDTSAAVAIPCGAPTAQPLRKQPVVSQVESKAAEIPKSSITVQHSKLGRNRAESGLVPDQGMEARARTPNSIPQARAPHCPQQVQLPRVEEASRQAV